MLYWCFRRSCCLSPMENQSLTSPAWWLSSRDLSILSFQEVLPQTQDFFSFAWRKNKIALSLSCAASKWVTPRSLPQSFSLFTVYLPASASPKDCLFSLLFLPIQFTQGMLFTWVQWVERGCRCFLGRFPVSEELGQLCEAGKGSFHRNCLQDGQRAW